jgi:hypothetical protein
MNTFIADNVSKVRLTNEEWLTLIDELDELVAELRYARQAKQRADLIEQLTQQIYEQLKNGPVPDADFPAVEVVRKGLPDVSEIPELE